LTNETNKARHVDIKSKEKKELKQKTYRAPEVTGFGRMQRYTLGGSPGTGDSGGAGLTQRQP